MIDLTRYTGFLPGDWTPRHTPRRDNPDVWSIEWSDDGEEVAEIVHGEPNAVLMADAPKLLAEAERLRAALRLDIQHFRNVDQIFTDAVLAAPHEPGCAWPEGECNCWKYDCLEAIREELNTYNEQKGENDE